MPVTSWSALDRHELPQRGLDLEDPFGRRNRGRLHELVGAEGVVLAFDRIAVEAEPGPVSSERTAFCSDSGNVRPIAITSPTDCICVPSTGAAPGQLLERPARELGDDVVDRRLERRRRLARDVVAHLVEPVPDRELGGDLRDRETRSPCSRARSNATRAGSSR